MDAHVHLNLGVYFDAHERDDGLAVVTSRTIPDFYWNYAFSESLRALTSAELRVAQAALARHGRALAVFQLVDEDLPSGWCTLSEEAWMWRADAPPPAKQHKVGNLEVRLSHQPDDEMRSVFEDAYSGEGTEGDIGYFKLPAEYGDAYQNAAIHAPAQLVHLAGSLNGQCVAVASVSLWNGIAGLYGVGTHHAFRERGFGGEISRRAIEWTHQQQAKGVLLQTTAGSAVETMYTRLGFERTHAGRLIGPQS